MKRTHLFIASGAGALGLLTFLVLDYVESQSPSDASHARSPSLESPIARAGSASESRVAGTSLTQPVDGEARSGDQLRPVVSKAAVQEGPLPRPSSLGLSARDELLEVLERTEGQFRDPEIRQAFSRERNKIVANFSQ
jgi:hypothetical protein